MYTDTHCHLNYHKFQNDLEGVLSRAQENLVFRIIVPGFTIEACRTAVRLAESHPGLFAAVGIHPNDAETWNEETFPELRELAYHPKVVGIGEIGLDYYRDRAEKTLQIKVFEKQLELAMEVQKPVIIHCRQAIQDVWALLKSWHERLVHENIPLASHPGVLHAYSENLMIAQEAIKHGFFIGIGGPITYTNAKEQQEIIRQLPLESLLLETDAPFLTPHPYRGKRNEPAFIPLIAEKLALLFTNKLARIGEITTANAGILFGWDQTA